MERFSDGASGERGCGWDQLASSREDQGRHLVPTPRVSAGSGPLGLSRSEHIHTMASVNVMSSEESGSAGPVPPRLESCAHLLGGREHIFLEAIGSLGAGGGHMVNAKNMLELGLGRRQGHYCWGGSESLGSSPLTVLALATDCGDLSHHQGGAGGPQQSSGPLAGPQQTLELVENTLRHCNILEHVCASTCLCVPV